jgi:7-cyano-7-deazaguanine reductase
MSTPADSMLGREVAYPAHYDPSLLFPIPREGARRELGLDPLALPFTGHDRWHAYELGWLDIKGKPQVGTATFTVPCDSQHLIESKSLKLYLNSLNGERFNSAEAVRERIATDLSVRAGAQVTVMLGLPPLPRDEAADAGVVLDHQDIEIDDYGPPKADYLSVQAGAPAEETLVSHLLKSNCPVTGQPDWATLIVRYRGARIDRAGLLRYIVSYRNHSGFHEQCVEGIFADLLRMCEPEALYVEARYTRRGGLDINPCRATPGMRLPTPIREIRQ